MKTKIKLSDLKISDNFKAHPPTFHKIAKCYNYYVKTGELGKPILVKDNVLVDGYTVYLVAKMFGVEDIEVEEI